MSSVVYDGDYAYGDYAYEFYFYHNGDMDPHSDVNRGYGISVRCVAR